MELKAPEITKNIYTNSKRKHILYIYIYIYIDINMKPCYPMKPKSNQREEIKIPKQLEIS